MASITRPQGYESPSALPLLAAVALLLSAAVLAGVLSSVHVPSAVVQGLPSDWGQRAAWHVAEALAGLGIACGLLAIARRHNVGTERYPSA